MLPRGLAGLANGRPKRVVAVAAVLAGVAVVLGSSVADRLDAYNAEDPGTESVRADALLERAGVKAGVDVVALVATPQGATSPPGRARVRAVAAQLRADPDVGPVTSFEQGGHGFVSRDGRSTYLAASLRAGADEGTVGERLVDRLGGEPGLTLGGPAVAQPQVSTQTSEDLKRAEILAFPLLFALTFLFFRSVVAALLPLLVGGMAIALTTLGLSVAAELGSISIFALNAVIALGLGLAIDYSLLMVSRYREEIARVGVGAEALRRTLATAGRTVMFSSVTVAAALASLLVFPQQFLYSMGVGGMMVALLAGAVTLLVLPAVLVLLGERVNALAPRRLQRAAAADARPSQGGWYRLARAVMRRPATVAVAATALLLALGAPALGIKFTAADASVLPTDASARQVDAALKRDFDVRRTTPITLVARTSPGPGLERYLRRLGNVPGVADVSRPRLVAGDLAVADAIPATPALSEASQGTLRSVRALEPPFAVLSRGQTASLVDLKHSITDHLPAALAILVTTTIVALFMLTGSVVLPIKALIMNLLTLSAAFGILVLVFQDGRLEGLLDYASVGALETTLPVFLFAVGFGLSTDYGVFLLARIKEARDAGAPDEEAIALGLERTGRIVTAAALLFSIAVGAFVTAEIVFIKTLGVGNALAVLIDASIVRALLVPSLMLLLGRWNWWAPRPLARLHARLALREGASA